MNIMLMITDLGIGGAERVVVDLADAFAAKGHKVCLVHLGVVRDTRPENLSVSVIGLGMRSVLDLPAVVFHKLPKLIHEFRPDVLHTHMFHANLIGRLLRLRISIPRLITTAHNTNEGGRIRMLTYRVTHFLSDVVTNVSEDAVQAFENAKAVPRGEMITVHNGIAIDRYRRRSNVVQSIKREFGITDSMKIVLSIGSLTKQKDHTNLIEAVFKVRKDDSDFIVLIAGEGPLREELSELVVSNGLESHVRLLGIRLDIIDLLSAADIFVLSSGWEGFPMVVGEAMSCGCVVVATNSGGVREFLGDYDYVVPPRSPMHLAANISSALSLSPEDKVALGVRLRSRVVEYFSLSAAVVKWEAIYQPGYCVSLSSRSDG